MSMNYKEVSRGFPPETPAVVDLERVVSRQIGRYVDLNFHSELGMSEADYRQSLALPKGTLQPETYRDRFDVLLVVETRIALARQHKLANITEYISRTDKIVNIDEVPDYPYAIWTHDGQVYRPVTVKQARNEFLNDEVGSLQREVTALYFQYQEYFRDRGIDAAGSRYGDGLVPNLSTYLGLPRVFALKADSAYQSWGAGSRGKEIIRLGA